MKRRTTMPVASSERVVTLTRERCEAARLNGERCPELDLRGGDGRVLCWVHRKAAEFRGAFALEIGELDP